MIRVSDYVVTPQDIAHAFRWRYVLGVVIGVGLAIGVTRVGAGLDVALFVGAIIATVIWKMDARIPFGAAILCFIGIMIASIMAPGASSAQGSLREQLAVTAFYCLVIGVALLIREQATGGRRKKTKAQPPTATATPVAAATAPVPVAQAAPAPQPTSTTTPVHHTQPAQHAPAYKPHLAPHPMLHKPAPAPVPQPTQNKPLSQPLAKSRIISDVMRPAQLQHQAHKPHRPHPKLIQL